MKCITRACILESNLILNLRERKSKGVKIFQHNYENVMSKNV